MAEGKNRPILITILAILYFVIGLLTIFSGIVLALGITAIDTDLALTGAAGGGILSAELLCKKGYITHRNGGMQ